MSIVSHNDIIDFLSAADCHDTLLVTDFDGTLYRGVIPAWSRGISNVDLGLFLCLLHTNKPVRWLRVLAGCIRTRLLERTLTSEYKAGRITLSDMDSKLIEFFSLHVLRESLPSRIEKAADLLSSLCYHDARVVLELLQNGVGCILIISKAFSFVLDVSVSWLKQKVKAEILWHSVCLQPASWWRIDRRNSILTRNDKSVCLRTFFQNNPRFTRAIVIGDTEDDIALYETAHSCLDAEKVLTVSIQAKDDKIEAASKFSFSSWRAFNAFLTQILHKPLRNIRPKGRNAPHLRGCGVNPACAACSRDLSPQVSMSQVHIA